MFQNSLKCVPVVAADAAAFPTPAILARAEYSWSFCARSCTNCFASVRNAPWSEKKTTKKPRGVGWDGGSYHGARFIYFGRTVEVEKFHPFRNRAKTIPPVIRMPNAWYAFQSLHIPWLQPGHSSIVRTRYEIADLFSGSKYYCCVARTSSSVRRRLLPFKDLLHMYMYIWGLHVSGA